MKYLIGFFLCIPLSSCAVHYYDPETKAEHIYGLGHMVMKAQDAGAKRVAIVRGNSYLGLFAGTGDSGGQFGAGWSSGKTIQILEPNAAVELLWPTSDFLNVRIGEPFDGIKKINSDVLLKEAKP